MVKVTYIGEVGEVFTRGEIFKRNEATDVDKEIAEKLSGNRFFKVEEEEPKKELTNKQMKDLLEGKDIEVPSGANKEKLLELMEANNLLAGSE